MYLIESEGARSAKSLVDLEKIGNFWTVESQLIRSVEQFIREAKAEVTAKSLLKVSQGAAASLPTGYILTNNYNSPLLRGVMNAKFEIGHLAGNVQERRLDVKWQVGSDGWVSRDELRDRLSRLGSSSGFAFLQAFSAQHASRSSNNIYSPIKGVTATGLDDYSGAQVFDNMYLLPNTPVAKLFAISGEDNDPDELIKRIMMFEAISHVRFLYQGNIDHFYRQFETDFQFSSSNGKDELITAAGEMAKRVSIYNPLSWKQRELKV